MEILLNKSKSAALLLAFAIISVNAFAQKPRFKEKKIARNVKTHISYLASDELEGRGTGSAGEQLSATYIAEQFKQIGLTPKGTDGYFQPMNFPSLRMAQANTSLMIAREVQTLFTDFYPLSASANNGKYEGLAINVNYGISDGGLNWDDYENANVRDKAVIMKVELPDGDHPHSKFVAWSGIEQRVEYAKSKGAKAVIFYSANKNNYPSGELAKSISNSGLPVLFVMHDLSDKLSPFVSINIDILLLSTLANNVVGYIDNGSTSTVVVGAHHDHLGYGEHGNSLAETEGDIHNGADDNASGVAALIELAKIIKKKKKRYANNNYLFVAFTAEELGLVGSKFFLQEYKLPYEMYNYMVNMDMVGHLDSTQKTLIINGVGTSPTWNTVIDKMKYSDKKIANIKTTESGIGASDHTSFYLQNIPAIHFFTGQHQYYHKPTDDIEIVNINGEAFVISYISKMLCEMEKQGKIAFTKTKDESQGRMSFKVTLGVMPDYVYDGEGMRIDGVKEGKPGAEAGIVKGDIVLSMNGKPISNMQDYMKALGELKEGDKIPVAIKRDGKVLELQVQF